MEAQNDAKLKFLPRHLQRSQPAASHKSKRRVTLEEENEGDEESDRRSVFDRLGPGATQKSEEKSKDSGQGHAMKGRNKRESDKSPDNLRLKFKGQSSGASVGSSGGKDRENKLRSQVVVRKSGAAGSDDESGEDSDSWAIDKLDHKKELDLERKRRELQQALSQLSDMEETEGGTEPKKQSDSSDSESSPERVHKKKKDKSKKKDKRKHKKPSADKETSAEKKELKRKHESDEEIGSPYKKRKKKKLEKKQSEEPLPAVHSAAVEELGGKYRKGASQLRLGKTSSGDPYDPEYPTPVDHKTTQEASPSGQRSRSSSPRKGKSRGKKKKKGTKLTAQPGAKSKKLLSPLKKVLKLKKGPESVAFSKRSRSEGRESQHRKRSRSPSSSSDSSSSSSPVRRKKVSVMSSTRERDRPGHRKVKAPQRRGVPRDRRSSSTSSSSSSSSSSSDSGGQAKGRKTSPWDRSQVRSQKGQASPTAHRDLKRARRRRAGSSESASRTKGTGADGRRRQSLDRGRGRERVRKGDQENRQHGSQSGRVASKESVREHSREGRGKDRRDAREVKDMKLDRRGGVDSKRDVGPARERDSSKTRPGRDRSSGAGMEKERGARADRERDRLIEGRRDESLKRESMKEKESGRADSRNEKDRDGRRASSERERDDRMRRSAGDFPGQMGSQERGGRFGQRGPSGESDRDRRQGEGSRFGSLERGRGSQYSEDRSRAVFGRGETFDHPEQRDNFDRERGRSGFSGPGRFPDRGGLPPEGVRGGVWEERRRGGDGFPGDWEGGRDGHMPVFRGGFRHEDEHLTEFGGRRDERGGGREERLLPFRGEIDSEKPTLLQDSGRFPPPPSQLLDRRSQSLAGERDEDSGRGGSREKGGRDLRTREGSQDSASKRDTRRVEKDSSGRRGGGERDRDDSRSRDSAGQRIGNDVSSRDRGPEKGGGAQKSTLGKKAGALDGNKQTAVMNLKSQPLKEDSPGTREETSLASLFSQTETGTAVKKKATKSFGGRKVAQKGDDLTTPEKTKTTLSGRLMSRGRRVPEKRDVLPKKGENGREDKGKTKERESAEGKSGSRKDEGTKNKLSRTPSPRDSQKSSADSPRSRHSQSRSSRRSPRSPSESALKRSGMTSRSPATKRGNDASRSPHKIRDNSRSPAPSASDKEKRQEMSRSPAPGGGRDRRKGGDGKRIEEERAKTNVTERGKKPERSRSHSRSDSESHRSNHSWGAEERKRRKSSDSGESLPAKLDGGDIAAAMLGEGIDDGPQDEKVFSDWSDDDDADNILIGGDSRKSHHRGLAHDLDTDSMARLHRSPGIGGHYLDHMDTWGDEGVLVNQPMMTDKPAIEKNLPKLKIVEDIQKEKPAREKRRRNTDDEGYEEISSDENGLDEEGERVNKRTIVSILDVDMASLTPLKKPTTETEGPVFQRFKPAALFNELGLSRALAGSQLFEEVQEFCQRQMSEMMEAESKEQTSVTSSDAEVTPGGEQTSQQATGDQKVKLETNSLLGNLENIPSLASNGQETLKVEPAASNDAGQTTGLESNNASSSPKKTTAKVPVERAATRKQFKFYSDLPACHKLNRVRSQVKSGVLTSVQVFRQALTARKDLEIRRQMCRIDPKYDQSAIYPSGVVDPQSLRLCTQLFQQHQTSRMPAVTPHAALPTMV